MQPSAASNDDRARFVARAFGRLEAFAGLVDIVPKSGKRIKLRLNEIQRRYCLERTQRDVVLKPRQVGFTTLEQAHDILHFLTVSGARVVVTCQSITEHTPSKVLSKNYEVMFESLERLGVGLKFRTRSATEWTLADRDASLRIVEAGASEAAAAKKGRAGTISRLHMTETAYYEYAEETLLAMLECVPGVEHGSEIVSESTPHGAGGTFYQQCKNAMSGESGYRLHFYPWYSANEYALPLDPGEVVEPQTERETALVSKYGVRPEQLKWYQRKLGEKGRQDIVDQEYPSDPDTCFLSSGRMFFDAATTTALLTKAVDAPVTQAIRDSGVTGQIIGSREVPALRVWHTAEPGKDYVLSADTSEGTGGDPSAAIVLERGTGRHMATLWGQFKPRVLGQWLKQIAIKYNGALIVVERNEFGGTTLATFEAEHKYANVYETADGKPGFRTDMVTRPLILATLEQAHRQKSFTTLDRFLLAEMRSFIVNKHGRPEARSGEHDDLVMATAIGWHVICLPMRKRAPLPQGLVA
jgi:hypothetical protein